MDRTTAGSKSTLCTREESVGCVLCNTQISHLCGLQILCDVTVLALVEFPLCSGTLTPIHNPPLVPKSQCIAHFEELVLSFGAQSGKSG